MIGNKRYSKDYVIETAERDGKKKEVATYVGVLYEFADARAAKRFKICMLALTFVMAACFGGCAAFAFGPFPLYAFIPFVFEILTVIVFAMISVEIALFRAAFGEPARARTFGRVRVFGVIHVMVTATAVIAYLVALASGGLDALCSAVFISCNLLSLAAACIASFAVGKIKLRTVRNENAVRIAEQEKKKQEQKAEREAELREMQRRANAQRNKKRKK